MTAVEVFRAFYAAYDDGDVDLALSYVSPHVRLEVRSDLEPDLSRESFEGHAGLQVRVHQIRRRWDIHKRWPVRVLIANANHAAVTTRCHATERAHGVPVVIRSAVFSTVRDGLIVRIDEVFYSTRMDRAEPAFARSDDALPSADG